MVWESESSVILLLIKSLPHLSDRVVIKICSRLDFSLYLNRAIHVRGNADDARAAFVYGWNLKIHMICAVSQNTTRVYVGMVVTGVKYLTVKTHLPREIIWLSFLAVIWG